MNRLFRIPGSILWVLFLNVSVADETVNVLDFGAQGDAVTDDTTAIEAALEASSRVHFPAGVYVIMNGIDLPESAVLTGDGSPQLGVFPRGGDDKRCFSPGKRNELPGTTLLFRGTGDKLLETGRTDELAELRYALKTSSVHNYRIEGLAIALDLDVYDEAGKLTTPENDGRSDFDVGLLVDDSAAGTVRDVAVFGFWKKAGLCLLSRGLGDNPDYNTFWNSSFMGERGVALIGMESEEGPGLSGTQFYGCRIFANDHHSRGAGQWGTTALFIDGQTKGKRADLNGHYFFGGCIRTYNNTAVQLDHASNVSFHGVVFEVPGFDGKNNARADTSGKVVGTENTRDVYFFGCRMHELGLDALGKTMVDGVLVSFPDAFNGVSASENGKVTRLIPGHTQGPGLQLTDDGSSANNGWSIRAEAEGELVYRNNNRAVARISSEGELTSQALESKIITARDLSLGKPLLSKIEGGEAEVRSSRVLVSSVTKTLLKELTGGVEGQLLVLGRTVQSETIAIPGKGEGNITLNEPLILDGPHVRITLMLAGDSWIEIARVE